MPRAANYDVMKEFEKRVGRKDKEEDDCWPWLGGITGRGYGAFWAANKTHLAHRYMYELIKGAIPKSFMVMHICNNKRCVNPNHLTVGTGSENMKHAISTGVQPLTYGERNGMTNFTNEQIKNIRTLCTKGYSDSILAVKYNVSRMTISRIRRRKTWAHI